MTALLRCVTESFGSLFGIALIYTAGTVMLFMLHRPIPIKRIPRKYLLFGGSLFVLYEIFMALAVAYANTHIQVMEVSILNYLWPTLMVLICACMIGGSQRMVSLAKVVPGALLATIGIVLAVGGGSAFSGSDIMTPVLENPAPFALALAASAIWAVYSAFTPKMADKANATAYFFMVVALSMWVVFLLSGESVPQQAPSLTSIAYLLGCAASVALGYALWNYAINNGNMRFLSTCSYSAPILSSIASAIILVAVPEIPFWIGAILVALGSLLSYFGMNKRGA